MAEITICNEFQYNIAGYVPPPADANNQRKKTYQGCSKTFIILPFHRMVYKTTHTHPFTYTSVDMSWKLVQLNIFSDFSGDFFPAKRKIEKANDPSQHATLKQPTQQRLLETTIPYCFIIFAKAASCVDAWREEREH